MSLYAGIDLNSNTVDDRMGARSRAALTVTAAALQTREKPNAA